MTHATQLAVFSLWTGLSDEKESLRLRGAYDLATEPSNVPAACGEGGETETAIWAIDVAHGNLPSCTECLALCHLAMVEHDRFREMEEPRRE